VLLLVGLEEFSYAEAAVVLDVPVGTVMSRLSRARAAMREALSHPVALAVTPATAWKVVK
jgi:RNA polymerase sigma-70 factor (ECF subfamily)